jgi:hypothetical protein
MATPEMSSTCGREAKEESFFFFFSLFLCIEVADTLYSSIYNSQGFNYGRSPTAGKGEGFGIGLSSDLPTAFEAYTMDLPDGLFRQPWDR